MGLPPTGRTITYNEIFIVRFAGGRIAETSAPSSLAVALAVEGRQTLVGFLRDGRMNVYAHPDRIRFASERNPSLEPFVA
jgi:hypothetical protein